MNELEIDLWEGVDLEVLEPDEVDLDNLSQQALNWDDVRIAIYGDSENDEF